MSQVSPIDTYYAHVTQQLAVLNAQVSIAGQIVTLTTAGIVDARDWPLTPPLEGQLYLLVLSQTPTGGTLSQRGYTYFLQWAWLILGTDIQSGQQAENRGDRYRVNMQIEEYLRQANYPGFTQRQNLACDSQGNLTFVSATESTYPASVLPWSGYEPVYWTELTFKPKEDNEQSGLLYGAAAVELYAYSDISSAIA